jgi:hypothetical protein
MMPTASCYSFTKESLRLPCREGDGAGDRPGAGREENERRERPEMPLP